MMRGLPILNYHAFDRSGGLVSTAPERLAATLDRLLDAGWRAVDLGRWVADGRPSAIGTFAATIDDGLASILDVVDVFTSRFVWPTIFLVTGRMGLDNAWPGQPSGVPRMSTLSWDEARSLRDAGFAFGAHTRTHARLDRLWGRPLADELRGSRDDIEAALGVDCPLVAYPYGLHGGRVRREAAGVFEAGFTAAPGESSRYEDPFALSRLDDHDVRDDRRVGHLLRGNVIWGPRRLARSGRMRLRLRSRGAA